jgi:hypothetical protein
MDIHEFSQQAELVGDSKIVEHGAKVRKMGNGRRGMEEGTKEAKETKEAGSG